MTKDPSAEYSIRPTHMRDSIRMVLDPVVKDLNTISGGFTSAHADVAGGHQSMSGGWCGGPGNGDVQAASGSFLNEVVWQLGRLSHEQAELATSLGDYAALLRKHIEWAEQTDSESSETFHAINRRMDRGL